MANKKEIKSAVEKVVKKAEEKAKVAEKIVETKAKEAEKIVEEKKPAAEKAVKEAKEKAVTLSKKTASTVKKTVKKFEPKKMDIIFEAYGKSYKYDDVVKAVNKACKGKTAKDVQIYVNAEEGAAYYVLDGKAAPENRVNL